MVSEESFKIFLMRQMQWGSPTYKTYTEDNSGKWKEMQSVDDFKEAEYLIYVNRPDFMIPFNPNKIFAFTAEPTEWAFSKSMWSGLPEGVHIYSRPVNHWHSFIPYSEFKKMEFPIKKKDLSWVTTSQGDVYTPSGIQKTEGQILRMNFLHRFLQKHTNKMYLYGRNLNHYYGMQNFQFCGGELTDLWDGIKDFRYTIAFETSMQDGYFCKLIDGILAGCMPIYWGCPDIDKYLPKNCVVRVDLRKDLDDVCDEVVDIAKSDARETNLDELKAAKELLLDKWNMFEIIYQEIRKYA